MPALNTGDFWISPALSNGNRDTGTVYLLSPSPTYVDYGERLVKSVRESEGRAIKQFSLINPKPKSWVWSNYTYSVPLYDAQYALLESLQEHVRTEIASGSAYVYLKETVTGMFGYYSSSGTLVQDWVRCRILYVDRDIETAGGSVRYPKTELVFTIDDPNFVVY